MRTRFKLEENDLKTDLETALKTVWKDGSVEQIIEEIKERVLAGDDDKEINPNGLNQEIYLHLCEFARTDQKHYFYRYEQLKHNIWETADKYVDIFNKKFPGVLYITEKGQVCGINIKIKKFIGELAFGIKNKMI